VVVLSPQGEKSTAATIRRPLAFGRAGWRYSLRHRKRWINARCRLIASWGWSRSQGSGCSPVKAVRELGLERRETVGLPCCHEIRLYAGNTEDPALLAVSGALASLRTCAVTTRQVRSISRKGWMPTSHPESSEAIRRTPRHFARSAEWSVEVKIWSDPHGDMGSQAEQKRPGHRPVSVGGNRRVGPYPSRAQET